MKGDKIKVNTQKNARTPNLSLNMDEKIYLAVAKHDVDKLSFVYTLACFKNRMGNSYDGFATEEIHSFKDPDSAQIYHDTIRQIIAMNVADKNKFIFFDFNVEKIKRFQEKTR